MTRRYMNKIIRTNNERCIRKEQKETKKRSWKENNNIRGVGIKELEIQD